VLGALGYVMSLRLSKRAAFGLSFHIRTYGCQMNSRDSEALGCLLEKHGMIEALCESDADVLIFNTCSVRDQAEQKAKRL